MLVTLKLMVVGKEMGWARGRMGEKSVYARSVGGCKWESKSYHGRNASRSSSLDVGSTGNVSRNL